MIKGLMSFFSTLQHSRAKTFKNFWRPLNYLSIGHNFVIYEQLEIDPYIHLL